MRSHAKAATAGSTQRQAKGLGRIFVGMLVTRGASNDADGSGARSHGPRGGISLAGFLVAVASLAALLWAAAPASAATITDRPLLFSFDGSSATGGKFNIPNALAVDQSAGDVYVMDRFESRLIKFNLAGSAQSFSATGTSSAQLPSGFSFNVGSDLAVDNSAVNPGRIYYSREGGGVFADSPAGALLWELPQASVGTVCGLAVDTAGHLWVADRSASKRLREFATTGSPPTEIGSISVTSGEPCRIAFDASGNAYVNRRNSGVDKYVGGVLSSTLDSTKSLAVALDQSSATGDVMTLHSTNFNEYDSTGTLITTIGTGIFFEAQGIAYDKALDRVYVSERSSGSGSNSVYAFGPLTTGTVPDVTGEAPSPIGVYKAKFHGKVNPQSVPNSYHFEWKKGTGASWAEAQSSPPTALPEDSSEHAVEFEPHSLRGRTTYQVRLVAENTANGLRASSAPQTFETLTASAAPEVTINPITAATTTTAVVSGTVNPKGDTADWAVETSTDPSCAGGFSKKAKQSLSEGSEAPVPVSYELTGLAPSQHYCVRLWASNSIVHNEVQKLVVDAGSGEYKLSFAGKSSNEIPYNASVNVLSNRLFHASPGLFEAHYSGGPGNVGGTNPYFIEFAGVFAEQDVPQLVPDNGSLSGGAATATVTTTIPGVAAGISSIKEFSTEPAVVPSQVSTAFVAPRLDTSARLNGYVNPQGANSFYPLTYNFEYSADSGETWTALPDQEYSGEAHEQIVLGEELTGLAPNTTYSYRFNAENAVGEASPQGEAKTFTTRSSAELAQPGRGIELVNNPDKGNQNVFNQNRDETPMSADGNRVLWYVFGGAPGGTASSDNVFLAERGANGWSSRNLVPPVAEQVGEGDFAYFVTKTTPDFAHFVFDIGPNGAIGGATKTVARLDRDQHQEVLATGYEEIVHSDQGEFSEDAAHVVIINPDNKQLEDIGSGTPELVSVMPDGTPSECGLDTEGASFVGGGGSHVVADNWRPGYRMMAAKDASRVYFEVKPNGSCGGGYALYERNRETEETFAIAPGSGGPKFIRATPDGRHGYFTTSSQLDPADTNGGVDIYRWDEESGESTCLTCPVGSPSIKDSGILISDDFSHIYFHSSTGTYVLEAGQLRFVGGPGVKLGGESLLSADGDFLVFRGSQGLGATLSADKLPAKCFEPGPFAEPAPCAELYRYDDRDGSIECLSCNHEGETTWSVGSPFVNPASDFRISADGSTVAFVTAQALLPEDVNGTADVYEWRNGAIHLVTDGVTEFQTGFSAPQVRAVSEDGSSILFIVDAPGLTGFEQDGLSNLYEARIGGGFEVPPAPAHCSEESCQGPVEKAPSPPEASSAAFSGHGNLGPAAAKRCGKAKLRRGGRCLSRRAIAQQACRRKTGEAKRRCIEAHMRQTRQRRHLRIARAHHDSRRAK